MRVRDHILLSTAGTALLAPWLGSDVVGFWAGGVLIDVDHYLWFCIRQRHLSPRAAVRFFNEAHPPQTSATRVLHHPIAVMAMVVVASRRRELLTLAAGMSLHVGLDAHHEARMHGARAEALARDRFTCRACGTPTPHVDTHLFRQPWLLPDYGARNLVSLCGPCHAVAHTQANELASWS